MLDVFFNKYFERLISSFKNLSKKEKRQAIISFQSDLKGARLLKQVSNDTFNNLKTRLKEYDGEIY